MTTTTSTGFRVLTWNILRTDRFDRIDSLVQAIDRIGPDAVLLQETSAAHAAAVGTELDMTATYAGDRFAEDASNTGNAVLLPSSVQFEPVSIEPLEAAPYELGSIRQPAAVRMESPIGQLTLGSVHLSHTKASPLQALSPIPLDPHAHGYTAPRSIEVRMKQVSDLNAHELLDGATIFGGDYNFVPDGPEYRAMIYEGWRDAWRAGPRTSAGATILEDCSYLQEESARYRPMFEGPQPGGRGPWSYTLDYQFCRSVDPVQAWVVGKPDPGNPWVSDHLGIVVDYHDDTPR